MQGEPADDDAQRRRHRVEPGDGEHVHEVHDLGVVQLLAVELEAHERTDEVVAHVAGATPLVQAQGQPLT